ncbi:hypothetical protein [Halomicronema sp. CCY15110]|uniref:hypothetical protein n=1 Tax=Halomicronema sp. CCY15110 TaxID=2767773 RepID=UPI00194E3A76|nr:hypothetical protein [Halomicronema sp. CCY15110]
MTGTLFTCQSLTPDKLKADQVALRPMANITKTVVLATQLQEKLDFVVVLWAKGLKMGKLANICHFAYKIPVGNGLSRQ